MSCQAIQHLFLSLSSFDKETKRFLQMSCGKWPPPIFQNWCLLTRCSLYWMVGHFFRRIRGLVDPHMLSSLKHTSDMYDRDSRIQSSSFDGYASGSSTKDVTHLRRSKGKSSTDIHFIPDMTLQTRKDLFFANPNNKQRFIICSAVGSKRTCAWWYAVRAMLIA